jgi:tetratricopeptide (TPR) repeat protein
VTACSVAFLVAVPSAFAAGAGGGGGDYGGGSGGGTSRSSRSPQKLAERHYESGLHAKEKAWKFEAKAAKEDDADDRAELLEKAQKAYEDAAEEQGEAVKADPKNYKAQNELGYALRKTGHYKEAIAAYDTALGLNGAFLPAVEYRAEAYLAVGQLASVKEAYMKLFRNDRKLADQLMTAIDAHLAKQPAGEGNAEFADWVKERKDLAKAGADLSQNNTRSW